MTNLVTWKWASSSWFIALPAVSVIWAVATALMIYAIGIDAFVAKGIDSQGPIGPAELAAAKSQIVLSVLAGSVMKAIESGLAALTIYVVIRRMREEIAFPIVLSVCAWASVIEAILALLARVAVILVNAAHGRRPTDASVPLDAAVLFREWAAPTPTWNTVLTSFDLLSLAFIICVACGLSQFRPRLGGVQAIVIAGTPWLVWTLFKLVPFRWLIRR